MFHVDGLMYCDAIEFRRLFDLANEIAIMDKSRVDSTDSNSESRFGLQYPTLLSPFVQQE